MLFLNPEEGTPVRAQGVMVTDMEIERILDFWQKNSDVPVDDVPPWEKLLTEPDEDEDEGLIEQAISMVRSTATRICFAVAAPLAHRLSARRAPAGSARRDGCGRALAGRRQGTRCTGSDADRGGR